MGTIIVGFEVYNTLLGYGEADAATFLLRTSEITPELICKAQFTTLNSQRISTLVPVALPFYANTEEKSNIEIKAEADLDGAANLLYIIKYY